MHFVPYRGIANIRYPVVWRATGGDGRDAENDMLPNFPVVGETMRCEREAEVVDMGSAIIQSGMSFEGGVHKLWL